MTALTWDETGKRLFETGIDRGVLYIPNGSGVYDTGYAWNGLTSVTETPAGAESNKQYADNIVYLNLQSAETFDGTINAYTYPDEFAQCDGTAIPETGMHLGQQSRKSFGMSYRTLKGNDVDGTAHGYKLHLVYGALASPSEKQFQTVNDSPGAIEFSWKFSTTPTPVGTLNSVAYKPTSLITLDSTEVDAAKLAALETVLYGAVGVDPRLPTPLEVYTAMAAGLTAVRMTNSNAPTYNSGTHVVTLPSVAHITWRVNGAVPNPTTGAQTAMTSGQTSVVTAVADTGYYITGQNLWVFDY